MAKFLFILLLGVSSFAGLNLLFPLKVNVEYSTVVTDDKGEIINAFLTSNDKWRLKTDLDELSPLLKNTIIQKEDRHFYFHAGVDPFAILRAAARNILHFKRTSGASTITMQVARALDPKPRNYHNKMIEIFRAWQLEWKYSKAEILQLYCNLLPYGGNIEGMKSASLLYFRKDPDHLSLAQITALCVIPNRPSSLMPGKNNDAIVRERNRWLNRFASSKVFTPGQIVDAISEPFEVRRHEFPHYLPQLSTYLRSAEKNPFIHTSIDLNRQLQTEKMVKDYSNGLRHQNITNASVVIIDNQSHEVISYVASADFNDSLHAGQVNGPMAIRQPGSTLKPLLYGMCIDAGLLTPRAIISDVPVNYDGYAPENFNRQFNGYVSMDYALGHSLNIPAVKSLNRLGKNKFISTLSSCGFNQVRKDGNKLGLSVILGGCGATLMELTALYSSFANGGVYSKPVFTRSPSAKHHFQVISPAASFMISETLSSLNRPDFPVSWQSTEHMPRIAWKTGTSYGRRDGWSIGYNKKFTVGVWVGNFSGEPAPGLTGAESATPLLFKIFNNIDYDADENWFTQPADCEIRRVCSETGMVPSAHCDDIVSDYFIPLISSAATCNNIQEVMVSPDEKISYCKTCAPASGYLKKLFRIVPPEMQAYYDDHHIAYQSIPPHNPDCERLFREGTPLIISPRAGSDYILSRKNPEPLQLSCRAGNDVGRVFWYINDRFYKTTAAAGKQFFVPGEGRVKVSCTDDKGRNKEVWINVKYVDL